MKIYVASSWRNEHQPTIVKLLEALQHQIYDFRNPPGGAGFGWEQLAVDKKPHEWTPADYEAALAQDRARQGYFADLHALKEADGCVCVMPCGRSAHLELGFALGQGKRTAIWFPTEADEPIGEPELMYWQVQRAYSVIDLVRIVRGWEDTGVRYVSSP